jgi:uncharacterized membrane protein/plastocyanin
MNQDIFEWLLLLTRWLHITVAICWIGTSIFFMWLDRSFTFNEKSKTPGHVGDLWMVHGGGFYHVEKLLMGPTKVPQHLHWFKWEAYWTWMSGMFLIALIFYFGDGTFLLDSMISHITYGQAVAISLFSIFGSWFFYDLLWENKITKKSPLIGHAFTLLWFAAMDYFLCHTLSGRAAYIHIGGMLGTWMTANVFLRIIPRQLKMVEAAAKGEQVNQEWAKNAKNRSTHNTYLTLPVIFIMLSNHFPSTYGHDYNWIILLAISAGGAAIREYFVSRIRFPKRALSFAVAGIALICAVVIFTSTNRSIVETAVVVEKIKAPDVPVVQTNTFGDINGVVTFEGTAPTAKKLNLPGICAKQYKGDVFSNEVMLKNSKLQNVLVRIIKGHEGKVYNDVPREEILLDQKGCIYTPRVVATRVGQKVTFINSDALFHNVRSISTQNEKFNVPMPHLGQRLTKIFMKPEITMQAKCSVHPWMGAHIAVMDHPFFAITGEDGSFKISKLPVGNYTIEAWHEIFGTQQKDIIVTEAGISDLKFVMRSK